MRHKSKEGQKKKPSHGIHGQRKKKTEDPEPKEGSRTNTAGQEEPVRRKEELGQLPIVEEPNSGAITNSKQGGRIQNEGLERNIILRW